MVVVKMERMGPIDLEAILTASSLASDTGRALASLLDHHRDEVLAFLDESCAEGTNAGAELPTPVALHLDQNLKSLLGEWADRWDLWELEAKATDAFWSDGVKLPLLAQTWRLELDVGDASVLGELSPLQPRILQVTGTALEDVSTLSRIETLTHLDISNTSVASLKCLRGLRGLRQLEASDTAINSLSGLQEIQQLEFLSVSDTQLQDLSPLAPLRQLEELHANATRISDLRAITGMSNLRVLNIANTHVADLSPLGALANLKRVSLSLGMITKGELKRARRDLPKCRFDVYGKPECD